MVVIALVPSEDGAILCTPRHRMQAAVCTLGHIIDGAHVRIEEVAGLVYAIFGVIGVGAGGGLSDLSALGGVVGARECLDADLAAADYVDRTAIEDMDGEFGCTKEVGRSLCSLGKCCQ